MGRSVCTPCNAIETVYFDLEPGTYCESCEMGTTGYECPECGKDTVYDGYMDAIGWQDILDDIRQTLSGHFPSLGNCDYWPLNESHAIMENNLVRVEISEYCGLIALSVVGLESDYYAEYRTQFAAKFGQHVAKRLREYWGRLQHAGTMSNGESVYNRVA